MKFPGHVDRIGRSDILKNMATNRISKFLITALTYLCGISCIINAGWVNAGDKPHIIYIMANDLGWRDLGFHGGRAPTPHIDALSGSGARLEGFYTLPHSSSTRRRICHLARSNFSHAKNLKPQCLAHTNEVNGRFQCRALSVWPSFMV